MNIKQNGVQHTGLVPPQYFLLLMRPLEETKCPPLPYSDFDQSKISKSAVLQGLHSVALQHTVSTQTVRWVKYWTEVSDDAHVLQR